MKNKIGLVILAIWSLPSFANDVFQQQRQSTMGNGFKDFATPQVQAQNQKEALCAQLLADRASIDRITEKQQWVPIEQQNANYYRMQQIKRLLLANGC